MKLRCGPQIPFQYSGQPMIEVQTEFHKTSMIRESPSQLAYEQQQLINCEYNLQKV